MFYWHLKYWSFIVARKGYGSIAHKAKPNGLLIPWPLRAFRYSRTITNSPLVDKPIKMEDWH